jgi:hypothetical protein
MSQMALSLGIFPKPMKTFLTLYNQKYDGHVTIIPKPKLGEIRKLMMNPEKGDISDAVKHSYSLTLRKISLIRAFYGVEREFDRYYTRLQAKMMAENNSDQMHIDAVFTQPENTQTQLIQTPNKNAVIPIVQAIETDLAAEANTLGLIKHVSRHSEATTIKGETDK